jgi:hypothetical protein
MNHGEYISVFAEYTLHEIFLRGDNSLWQFPQGIDFHFRGETPSTKFFRRHILPFGNFRGEYIFIFAGRHFARRFFVFSRGVDFCKICGDSLSVFTGRHLA